MKANILKLFLIVGIMLASCGAYAYIVVTQPTVYLVPQPQVVVVHHGYCYGNCGYGYYRHGYNPYYYHPYHGYRNYGYRYYGYRR